MSSRIIPILSGDDLPDRIERKTAPELIHITGGREMKETKIPSMESKYKGKIIKAAKMTVPKPGKSRNKTSSIQVFEPGGEGYILVKQFRYKVSEIGSFDSAVKRAKDWIDGKPPKLGGAREGSGAKTELEGGRFRATYLDTPTVTVLTMIGEGNLSRGIRLAAIIFSFMSEKDRETAVEVAKGYEPKKIREEKS